MFLMSFAKAVLLATCLAVVWGFMNSGQISLALAVGCMGAISLLTA